MAASMKSNTQSGSQEGTRFDLLEFRVSCLEDSVNRAVGTLLPKVEALLSERGAREWYSFNIPPLSPTAAAPPTSLLELAERGDGETLLRMLADEQVDVLNNPPRTSSGDTALHVAASGGHLKAVMALLGAGTDVDVLGHRLRTPLHCAATHGHLAVTRRLLEAGAKFDIKDRDGVTAVDLSARGSKDLIELFLQRKAPVDTCNEDGESLLVQAARAKRWENVNLLLERGASATKCKTNKECTLVFASRDGQVVAVRHLLRRGAASNTEQVKWALGEAQSAAVVWAFVDSARDQVRGEPGRWSLLQAASGGHLGALVALLEAGVKIDTRNSFNQTPLHFASWKGQLACVKELLHQGANVNAKDNLGSTPLHFASQRRHVECVRKLLGGFADADAKNKDGDTPLHCASFRGHVDCVRELLGRTADANAKNNDGYTPLHLASENDHVECVRELLGRNTDADAKNNDGNTPLHGASHCGHVQCVRVLCAAGASTTVTNNEAKTPFEVAKTEEVRNAFFGN